jgi:F5/8 type C domain
MRRRQNRSSGYLFGICLACGCSVYGPGLVGDDGATSLGGTRAGGAGDHGGKNSAGTSSGQSNGGTESAGSATRGGAGTGAAADGGSVGVAGSISDAGESTVGVAGSNEGGAISCLAETVPEFCKRVGKDCGTVNGTDPCGNAVSAATCGSCQGFKLCGGGARENVCGTLTDAADGGIATASSVGSIGENGSKAFDGKSSTKWYAGDGNKTGWLAYQFPGNTSHIVHSYSLTSAGDVPGRDPSAWQLQASNDGGNWVNIDQRSGEVFATRFKTISYTSSTGIAYRWYRLLVTANSGATALQLAELVLYGT